MTRGLILLAALVLAVPALADSLMPAARYANEQLPDPQQEARAKALMETLRCLVCQGQSIADSDAEMAGDMRAMVRTRIAAGEEPEAIRKWLIERYGDWVSYSPPLDGLTWPLWGMPILFLARHYRLALLIGVAATLFTALPMMVYGPQIYRDWLLALSQDNHWIFTTTVSLPSYFQRLGLKEIGAATAVLVLAGACALAWIRRPNAQWATMLGLLTGILASPLAWFHYLLVLLPFLVSMKWNTQIALGAAAFVVLQPTIVLYAMGKGLPVLATLGGAMLFATLLLGWGIVRQMLEAPSADEARRADA